MKFFLLFVAIFTPTAVVAVTDGELGAAKFGVAVLSDMWAARAEEGKCKEDKLCTAVKYKKVADARTVMETDSFAHPMANSFEQASLLHMAAKNNDVAMVQLLLDFGAVPSAHDIGSKLDTPLHIAASNGYSDVAQCLLRAGADAVVGNKEDRTAKMLATGFFSSNEDIIAMINGLQDPFGDTRRKKFIADLECRQRGYNNCRAEKEAAFATATAAVEAALGKPLSDEKFTKLGVEEFSDLAYLDNAVLNDLIPHLNAVEQGKFKAGLRQLVKWNPSIGLVPVQIQTQLSDYFNDQYLRGVVVQPKEHTAVWTKDEL